MSTPFTVKVPATVVEDLKHRLKNIRWPEGRDSSGWEAGTPMPYLKELCAYWENEYDWEKQQKYLNTFSHFMAEIDKTSIHFIYEKGKGEQSFPLLLTHGFPDSFVRFLKVIPDLTAADEDGFSFDVIIPSIPGYGFSGYPAKREMHPGTIADLFNKLITDELGYDRFFAHGGDWGSSITEQLAIHYPQNLLGMHLTDIPYQHLFSIPEDELTTTERDYLEAGQKWVQAEGGYAILQSNRPQTVGFALNDSPAGLASWIIEKFYRWSDCRAKLENCFSRDELLTNVMIYWSTQTINSAMRLYYEAANMKRKKVTARLTTPTAVAIFPKDLLPPPHEFADRIYTIHRWTDMPSGGHFAAMEQPRVLSNDIRAFAKKQVGEMVTA